jgi:hypothetical protein
MSVNPNDPQFDIVEYRKRQTARARLMAALLAAFVVLLFFITIAKMQLYA